MLKTLVFGASTKSERYAYKAITRLRAAGHPVVAIAKRAGKVADVDFLIGEPALEDIHTITLYVSPRYIAPHIDYLISLKPKRIIFNPGTENPEFVEKAKAAGILTIEACTLVMLSIGVYEDMEADGVH